MTSVKVCLVARNRKALRVNANDVKVFLAITQVIACSSHDSWDRWKAPELNVDSLVGCFLHLPQCFPLPSEYWHVRFL